MKFLQRLPMWLSVISICVIIYDLGFDQSPVLEKIVNLLYFVTLGVGALSLALRYLFRKNRPPLKVWVFDSLYFLLLLTVFLVTLEHISFIFLDDDVWKYLALFMVFVREYSLVKRRRTHNLLNPAQLFIISFVLIIVIGSFLLMLPNATTFGISFVDALFTSTSAVCVTGLTVVDTATAFSAFGQVIILILMQIGGLGVMTFTTYFAYFFQGGISYENQLMMGELTSSQKLPEVLGFLRKILLVTLIVEAMGIIIIYVSVQVPGMSVADRFFFSVFHGVAAFCNAGFSTLTANLYDPSVRFNYTLQMTVAMMIILGGIGFPILFNLMGYIRYQILNSFVLIQDKMRVVHKPWVLNLNTRIVLITTTILLVVGTGLILVLEYDNTLSEHTFVGKWIIAFASAVAPRTAGFNAVDMTMLHFPTIMFIFFLMWVGASPASTGGGIKTSTIAIATLNFVSLARNKERVELFRRQVSALSVQRAFAIICLSLVVIGCAVFMLAVFEKEKHLLPIAFECFSAYGTVGLSLGITASLTDASKVVIILTMFVGRVGMLTILIAVFRKARQIRYQYPTEAILIN